MLLALDTPQTLMMLVSFAFMAGFASLGLWMWVRMHRSRTQEAEAEATHATATAEPATRAAPAEAPVELEPEPEPAAPSPAPLQPPPSVLDPDEPTEFIALPGRRDPDAPSAIADRSRAAELAESTASATTRDASEVPSSDASGTEFIAAPPPSSDASGTEFIAAPLPSCDASGTEFIAAPAGDVERSSGPSEAPPDPTDMLSPADLARLHSAAKAKAARASGPPADKTQFIAPPTFAPPAPRAPSPPRSPSPPPTVTTPASPTVPTSTPMPPAASSRPTPMPPAASSRPTPTATSADDLAEHLRLALDAFVASQADDASATQSWRGHLEVLASAPHDDLRPLLDGALTGPPQLRWSGALLALLHNKSKPARRTLPPLLETFDDERRAAALRTLRSWDVDRARPLADAALADAQGAARTMWLRCFADAGWDPGRAVIEAALDSDEAEQTMLGLILLPRSSEAQALRSLLATHLFSTKADLRMTAIETASSFADNSAWLICKQLARNPSYPRAAVLVGLLGDETEVKQLRAALDASVSPALLTALALSGRRFALDACAAHLDKANQGDQACREAARAGLELAAGQRLPDAEAARAWLANQDENSRVIGGAPRTPKQLREVLVDADEPLRRALAGELRIRSGGALHLDVDLLPAAWREQLRRLDDELAAVELDRAFPWF